MNNNNVFSCYIIGNNNLTLQCAEIILNNGHKLLGLISSSRKIKAWCITNNILNFENIIQFKLKQPDEQFDYLFSIVNEEVLSKEILSLPKRLSINYHDSPLPKYAGLYATTHAILNNEKQHAVTWHIMKELIDAGDILQQPFFPIEKAETALSLNLKCYEHAIKSFGKLIKDLATNNLKPIKQNLNNRSYFGLKSMPPNLGFILWDQPLEEIDKMCRALTLGNYHNKLGLPKIIINNEIFVITHYKKLNVSSNLMPGTIAYICKEEIQIATQTSDILISNLIHISGKKYSIAALCEIFKLKVHLKLPKIKKEILEKLANHPALEPKIEKFWINEFNNIKNEVQLLAKLEKKTATSHNKAKIVNIPNKYLNKIKQITSEYNIADVLFAISLIYLYRLNNYQNISIKYSNNTLKTESQILDNFLSNSLPLTTNLHENISFFEALKIIVNKKNEITKKHTFTNDIFMRYPKLNNISDKINISITITNTNNVTYQDNKLNIYIASDGTWFGFNHSINLKSYTKSHLYLRNMNKNFLAILSEIAKDPNKTIFEFSIINEKEKNALMLTWNNTQKQYNYKKLLHQHFETQVTKTPKSTALIFNNTSINYEELNKKANKLGHYLRAIGVKPNDIIGIYLERGLEMVIGILGILKAGGAYLPLDPSHPDNRTKHIIKNSKACIVLVSNQFSIEKIYGALPKIIDINTIITTHDLSNKNLSKSNTYEDIAYAIYTSGTTGNPKGVVVSHKSICNHMLWMQAEYQFHKNDIFLQKTPFTFDASVWEFFAPLFIGAKLIIAPSDYHTNPYKLIKLIQKYQVTILQLVPTMLNELIYTNIFSACHSLKQVFVGGEALLSKTIKEFFKINLNNTKLHNLYGPTETTIEVLTTTCMKTDANNNSCRIGKPIFNTKVYVLDDMMQLVPIGIPGELYITGDSLSLGYLNDKAQTDAKFITNPFSTDKKSRLYKSGDLVKWLSDGNIEYLGRIDNQIKIRGYRVEVGEVESILRKINSIEQCIVVTESNKNHTLSLSAYIVLKKKSHLSVKIIREFLSKHLPEYMIPSNYFIINEFLITSSGKIDRNNLPMPIQKLNPGNKYTAATTTNEKLLKKIWCSVLKIDNIGIHDDFFEVGGNSLLSIRIISLIKDQFSITLSLKNLFEFTTIHSLAKEIEHICHTTSSIKCNFFQSCIIPLKITGDKTPIFLIHPVGGSVFWYQLLSKHIDNDQPLYAIQDPGLDKNLFLFNSLEEMANHYIQAIKTIQPIGPYIIGGASFGSTVAIAIAKQLQDKKEKVPVIISFDGWASYPTLQNNEQHFQNIMREQNKRIMQKYIEYKIENSEFLLKLQSHRESLLTKYQLPIIKSKLVLFKAADLNETFQFNAPFNWWDNYCNYPIELHLVPGNHETMFYEPYIRVLARKLNSSLNEKNLINISLEDIVN